MNFHEQEKPVVLHFVGLMRLAAAQRRKAMKRGVEWGCCDRYGSMYHVNGIPRQYKYCPLCKPLRSKYHRCKLDGYAPERYEKVKAWRRSMKSLSKLAKVLMANAENHPYTGSMTPLCDFRGSWDHYVIEYYHRQRDGMTVLNVRSQGTPIDPIARADIRNAFGVPANLPPEQDTEEPKPREDGAYIDRFVWRVAKQAAMVLA